MKAVFLFIYEPLPLCTSPGHLQVRFFRTALFYAFVQTPRIGSGGLPARAHAPDSGDFARLSAVALILASAGRFTSARTDHARGVGVRAAMGPAGSELKLVEKKLHSSTRVATMDAETEPDS